MKILKRGLLKANSHLTSSGALNTLRQEKPKSPSTKLKGKIVMILLKPLSNRKTATMFLGFQESQK